MIRSNIKGLAAIAAFLVLGVANTHASTIIDLTTGPDANNFAANNIAAFGGSFIVEAASSHSTGGGVVDTFLRLQTKDSSEQGYNTDARPLEFDAKGSREVTHALRLSDVPTVTLTVNGVTELYRQFVLNINQNDKDEVLSLNQVQFFLSASKKLTDAVFIPEPTGLEPPAIAFVSPDTTEVFRLNRKALPDPNFLEIKIKDADESKGSPVDMLLYVRDAAFQEADTSVQKYVYLYSQFGTPPGEFENNGRYEEWGVLTPSPVPIPEPSTVALALAGLGTLGFAGLRRRSRLWPTSA